MLKWIKKNVISWETIDLPRVVKLVQQQNTVNSAYESYLHTLEVNQKEG